MFQSLLEGHVTHYGFYGSLLDIWIVWAPQKNLFEYKLIFQIYLRY